MTRAQLMAMLAKARAEGPRAMEALRAELSGRAASMEFGKTVDRKSRTAQVIVTTERAVPMIDWERWEVVDEVLAMGGFQLPEGRKSVPMLDTHNRGSIEDIIGNLDGFKVVGDGLEATAHFDDGAKGEMALKLAEKGMLTDFSAGYNVEAKVYVGEKATVDIFGKKYTGPLNVATKWTLKEASACPIGADVGAGIRGDPNPHPPAPSPRGRGGDGNLEPRPSAGQSTKKGERAMNRAELLKALKSAREAGDVALMERYTAELKALDVLEANERSAAAQPLATVIAMTPEAEKKAKEDAVREERQRCEDIRSLGEMAGMDTEIVEKAVKDGLSMDDARKAFKAEFEKRKALPPAAKPGEGQRIDVGPDKDKATRTQAICDAWMMRSGILPEAGLKLNGTGKSMKPHERSGEFMGLSLSAVMRRTLRENGVRGVEDLEGLALLNAVRSSRTSSSDLNNILGGVINRSLEAGWGLNQTTWRRIAKKRSVKDFNTLRLIARGGFGLLRQIGNDAEVPVSELGDGKYETMTLTTFSDRIIISDEVFINDDIGALTDLPFQKGLMAEQTVNHLVLYTLMQGTNNVGPTMNEDSLALFHTSHGNLQTSGAAPSATTLAAARAALRKMTRPSTVPDAAAVPLNLQPRWVMVPTAHEDAVLQLLSAEAMYLPGANNETLNTWRGKLEPLIEPVLDSGATVHLKSGSVSSTAVTAGWYVGTNPAEFPCLTAGFLNGNEQPVFENARPLEYLGEEWRTTLRVAAALQDWRGLYFNDGA